MQWETLKEQRAWKQIPMCEMEREQNGEGADKDGEEADAMNRVPTGAFCWFWIWESTSAWWMRLPDDLT